ncbi:NAD(P)-binding domain-containing protein [Marilutibacter aestuarii]|uniref:NAD(P)-binding domain-containing protein n=1 Tax=Marilutibacter aestuarii TaxID=1706195 RepID=UPI001476AC4E|nr:NAD(P)-binding domain-containing protein [Lysobacter aestuarii]
MIAIIGAGPAGISLAAALDAVGVPYEVFEKEQIGHTWRAAPADLRVLSPWWTDVLHPRAMFKGNPFRKPLAGEYLDHLLATAGTLRGKVHQSCAVTALQRVDGGWMLQATHGAAGPFAAVVLATGYFSMPRQPDPAIPTDGSVRVLHASAIRDYAELDALRDGARPVVVVGRRVTAGQLMLELSARDIPCAISVRSPLEYRRHGLLADAREVCYFFWETLEAWLKPGLRRPSFPVMEGGRTRELVQTGRVKVMPRIRKIERGELFLEDGSRLPAAAVLHATGYQADLRLLTDGVRLDEYGVPLHSNFEISGMSGIHLLGFDNLYDHRSRYLRGIRADARRLASKLVEDSRLSK